MRRAGIAAALAGAASLGLHAGGLVALAPPEAPATLAGGPAQLAMIGNSFADAAAGRLAPVTPVIEDVPEVEPVDALAPAAVSEAVAPVAPTPALPAQTPVTAAPVARTAPVLPVAPVIAQTPETPAATPATVPPPERIVAQDIPQARTPDADTPRPQPRAERAPDRAEARAAPPPPAGSAAQDTRAGEATGQAQGNAPQTAQGGTAQSASDGAAIAAYPQQVNRHLSRLRRPATRFDGSAVVAFTIAPGGGLAAIAIARSSGNAEFDSLALSHVQRAAPFPAPPAGAQRAFNVTVQGR
jgi:protein TonB